MNVLFHTKSVLINPENEAIKNHLKTSLLEILKKIKPIFHQKMGWRRVEFASPTQKSSLKLTWRRVLASDRKRGRPDSRWRRSNADDTGWRSL